MSGHGLALRPLSHTTPTPPHTHTHTRGPSFSTSQWRVGTCASFPHSHGSLIVVIYDARAAAPVARDGLSAPRAAGCLAVSLLLSSAPLLFFSARQRQCKRENYIPVCATARWPIPRAENYGVVHARTDAACRGDAAADALTLYTVPPVAAPPPPSSSSASSTSILIAL